MAFNGTGGTLLAQNESNKAAQAEIPTETSGEPAPSSARARRVQRILSALLILLGLAVASGWVLDIPELKSILPQTSTMKFNSALGFLITGCGLLLAATEGRPARLAAAGLGLALLALGAATLFEYFSGIDLGIDQAVAVDTGTLMGSGFPGRMSPLTAFAWTMLGAAIVLLGMATRRSEVIIAHLLAMAAGVVGILGVAGYAFGAEAFFGIGFYTLIAIHTAAGLLVASAAALMTRAREGWLEPYVHSPAALGLLSRLIPLALGVPSVLGLLIMGGAGLGAYNAPFGFALFIPTASVAMVLCALWVAGRQREAEEQRLRYQRHLQLVVAELNHRVKNTLAIIQSFAHQSLKGSASPEEAAVRFEGRLAALASAHRMLTDENWDNVRLTDLVADAMDPHNDTGTRFAVDGPDLMVSPKTSITLVMTLHELATNSTKYGALGQPGGYVRLNWDVADGQFRLAWKDVGGPACKEPVQSGFGTRMLKRALAAELGGQASLHYEPDGFRYELVAPARAEL